MADTAQDLSFKLLSLLSKERGIYGLRNGDHERYRKHCANKIHRLRLGTGLTSGKKGYKKPAEITVSSVKDVKHLQLLLFSAERALAHSHELKALLTRNPSRAIKKDQLSWLRRAHKLSSSLHSISSSLASEGRMNQRTLSEITIYHLSITSELSFEKGQWGETITSLAVRRRLLSTLSEAARESYDQALALEFMDAYDPLIRFSAYKLGRSESHDIAGVVKDVDDEMQEEALPGIESLVNRLREELGSEQVEEGRRRLEDLKFAGEAVELRNAEMVDVMTRVQGAMEGMEHKGKGMRGWDKVLGVLGEAEGLARKLVEDHEASGQSNPLRSAETSQSLSKTHQYTVHLLLTHRIRRDLLLADTLSSTSKVVSSDLSHLAGSGEGTGLKVKGGKAKVEEAVRTLAGVVKLYDQILQSLGQVMGLGLVQESEEVRLGVDGLEAYYHAMRNFYLARLHTVHPSPSYSSAIHLLSRSSLLIRQAQSSLSGPVLEPITTVTPTDISTLETNISILDLAAKRALFAEKVEKPLFFDNAFNYVDMPMEELLFRAGKGPKPEPVSSSVPAVTGVIHKAEEVLNKVTPAAIGSGIPDRVKGLVRSTRESTPSVSGAVSVRTWGEDEDMEDDEEKVEKGQQGKKGWLGGWFGRG